MGQEYLRQLFRLLRRKRDIGKIDTIINRKSFPPKTSFLAFSFSIYKIRGGECSPPLPSCLAIYRCTRHRISSVNACVYLSAKILVFFETSKLFIIFFKNLCHTLLQVSQAGNLDHSQKVASLIAHIHYAFMKQNSLLGQRLILALCSLQLQYLILQRRHLFEFLLCFLQLCFLSSLNSVCSSTYAV